MKREYFAFFASWYDAICELDDQSQLALYNAIMQFALTHTEPELTGVTNMVWKIIRPILDAGWKKFENGCKGGCPKGTEKPSMRGNRNACKSGNKTETKPNQNQDETESKAIKNKELRIKNEELRINNTAISDEPILSAKTSFAPGCGNDVCFDVFNLYNRIIGRRKLEPKNLTAKRRDAISFQYRQLGCDISRFEKVFKGIAKAKDPNINNPYFDSIFDNKIYAPYWMNADK